MARCYTHRRFLPREPSRSRAAAASEAELDRRKEIREPVTDYEVLIMLDPELPAERTGDDFGGDAALELQLR